MAKKRSGYSKSRKDWLGRPVTEHFNSKGEKTGRSKKHTDFLGRSVTERYNTKGEKTGYTKRRETFWGTPIRDHYNKSGEKTGYSKNGSDFWGTPTSERYNTKDEKIGQSKAGTTFWGTPIIEHYREEIRSPSSLRTSSQYEAYGSEGTSSDYPASGNSATTRAPKLFGLVCLLVVAVIFRVYVEMQSERKEPQNFQVQPGISSAAEISPEKPPEREIRQDASKIPPLLKKVLDREYPGWFLPIVSTEDRKICAQSDQWQLPGFVWGDFNGDGVRDYGIAIAQGKGLHTLVFLGDGLGFRKIELDPSGWNILSVEPSGSKLPHLDNTDGAPQDTGPVTLQNDALIGIACQQSAVAYVYANGNFEHFWIED